MPWHIENDNPACAGHAVVKDEDREVVGCHKTRQQALAHLAALNAAEDDADDYEDDLEEMLDDDADPLNRADGYQPTGAMAEEAARGLAWRQEYGRGGTAVGVARARDISNRRTLPLETVNRMVSYFARHEIDKEGQGWSPGEDGYPSAGRIAWALWGGDAGRSWANSIADQNRATPNLDLARRILAPEHHCR